MMEAMLLLEAIMAKQKVKITKTTKYVKKVKEGYQKCPTCKGTGQVKK